MIKQQYNLIDEPQIKAITIDGKEQLFNLKNFFSEAHNIFSLTGETELQNTAILRLLIAISVTCFYRYDENGTEIQLEDEVQALSRYKSVWNNAKFSERFINTYFEKQYHRFFLFGGERPFYQVANINTREIDDSKNKKNPTGKTYLIFPFKESDKLSQLDAQSFNGEILQSGNSSSPFSNKSGDNKNKMTYAEAARQLIYYMNFADCSSKIPGKWNAGMTFTSSGANIHPIGRNMFETLMLCSVLLDSNKLLYNNPNPAQENNKYTEINDAPFGDAFPTNIPELYTQQSRKVILHCQNEFVDGMYVAAGDRYGTINAFIEPMFAFHQDKSDKNGNLKRPNHINNNSNGQKEFKNIFCDEGSDPARQISLLFGKNILPDDINIPYIVTDIAYGSMECGIKYTVNTNISVNKKYFVDSLELDKAKSEINRINKISYILEIFGQEIDCAIGANKTNKNASLIRKQISVDYEKNIGTMFQNLLMNKITEDQIHEAEIKYAEKIANNVLVNLNIIAIIGHGEQSIGTAEKNLQCSLYHIKKELGYINNIRG